MTHAHIKALEGKSSASGIDGAKADPGASGQERFWAASLFQSLACVSDLLVIIIQLFYEHSKKNLKDKVGTMGMGEKLR